MTLRTHQVPELISPCSPRSGSRLRCIFGNELPSALKLTSNSNQAFRGQGANSCSHLGSTRESWVCTYVMKTVLEDCCWKASTTRGAIMVHLRRGMLNCHGSHCRGDHCNYPPLSTMAWACTIWDRRIPLRLRDKLSHGYYRSVD